VSDDEIIELLDDDVTDHQSNKLAIQTRQDRQAQLVQWKQTVTIAIWTAFFSQIVLWMWLALLDGGRSSFPHQSYLAAIMGAICSSPLSIPCGIVGALLADGLFRESTTSVPRMAIAFTIILEITMAGGLVVFVTGF